MLTTPHAMSAELQGLIQSNGERLQNLGALHNIGVDIQRLMLHFLVEELYPEADRRAAFELKFQETLAQVLTDMETQASTTLVAPPPGLLLPNGVGSG